jgi:hypothetical protein
MHTYIYNAQGRLRWNSHVSPARPEPGKIWHGLSRNQDAVGEHDEYY